VTLEGIALIGDPDYRLVMEAYPFVARKLLKEDRPAAQKALQEVLYASTQGGGSILQGKRLAVMLNSAMGVVARESGEGVFVDLDTIPEDSISLTDGLRYLLSPRAESLRGILEKEAVGAADVLLRQAARKSGGRLFASLPRAPKLPFELPFGLGAPLDPENIPGPFLVPSKDLGRSGNPRPVFASPSQVLEAAAPKLSREEELFAISLADLAQGTLGSDAAVLLSGDALLEPAAAASLLLSVFATGQAPTGTDQNVVNLANAVREQLAPATVASDEESSSDNSSEESLDDIIAAVRDLSPEESEILQGCATRVAEQLWDTLVERLEVELLEGEGATNETTVAASAR
jgi:hypothetical protein